MQSRILATCGVLLGQLLAGPGLAAGPAASTSPAPLILAQAQPQAQPTPQQRAAMLSQWLQASQAQVRAYEWIETTVVSKDGEEKSRSQKRCYYGADGALQKIVLQESSSDKGGPPGVLPIGKLVKKVGEKKKEEMADYMHSAVELVHGYIPPNPNGIQQSINGGKMSMQMLEPGRRVRLNFADYLKPGDSLGVEMELPTNRLLGMSVASYLDTAQNPVALNVAMGVLPDGTIYAARSVLDAKAKGLSVTVENTGYRRMGR